MREKTKKIYKKSHLDLLQWMAPVAAMEEDVKPVQQCLLCSSSEDGQQVLMDNRLDVN